MAPHRLDFLMKLKWLENPKDSLEISLWWGTSGRGLDILTPIISLKPYFRRKLEKDGDLQIYGGQGRPVENPLNHFKKKPVVPFDRLDRGQIHTVEQAQAQFCRFWLPTWFISDLELVFVKQA